MATAKITNTIKIIFLFMFSVTVLPYINFWERKTIFLQAFSCSLFLSFAHCISWKPFFPRLFIYSARKKAALLSHEMAKSAFDQTLLKFGCGPYPPFCFKAASDYMRGTFKFRDALENRVLHRSGVFALHPPKPFHPRTS